MRTLADYEPYTSSLLEMIVKDTHLACKPSLGDILAQNPRLVVAFNHSSPLSWVPAACLLNAHVCARGGGQRKPVAVMDRAFFQIPFVKELASFLTQSERPHEFEDVVSHLESNETVDFVVFPEGSNCFFGEPDEIQEYRSPRFVEVAVQVGIPILISVHRGSEEWAKAIPVDESAIAKLNFLPTFAYQFLESRLRKTGLFALPWLPKPIGRFEMLCELYLPELKREDLSDEPSMREQQIRHEAEKVRARMIELKNMLRARAS